MNEGQFVITAKGLFRRRWYFTFTMGNYERMLTSEPYNSWEAAYHAIEVLRAHAPSATVVERTKP